MPNSGSTFVQMKAALRAVGGKKSPSARSRDDLEATFESNTGFDPEDPPASLSETTSAAGPPWESGLQTDHRRLMK